MAIDDYIDNYALRIIGESLGILRRESAFRRILELEKELSIHAAPDLDAVIQTLRTDLKLFNRARTPAIKDKTALSQYIEEQIQGQEEISRTKVREEHDLKPKPGRSDTVSYLVAGINNYNQALETISKRRPLEARIRDLRSLGIGEDYESRFPDKNDTALKKMLDHIASVQRRTRTDGYDSLDRETKKQFGLYLRELSAALPLELVTVEREFRHLLYGIELPDLEEKAEMRKAYLSLGMAFGAADAVSLKKHEVPTASPKDRPGTVYTVWQVTITDAARNDYGQSYYDCNCCWGRRRPKKHEGKPCTHMKQLDPNAKPINRSS